MSPLWTRGVGAIPLLRGLLPPAALDAFAGATWLGSVPVILAVVTVAYWFGPRRRGALGLAAVLCAFSLTVGLKALFALPRPPTALRWVAATGYGFPSGHAMASTVGWGYLATTADRWTPRRRAAGASVLIGAVMLSRVALGVHYVVDVVAGLAVGLGVLLAVDRLDRPQLAFAAAALAAGVATITSSAGGDALLLLGGTVTGAVLWPRLAVPAGPWGRAGALPAVVGGAGLGAIVAVGYAGHPPTAVEPVVGAVAVAGLLGLPALVGRLGWAG